MPPARSSVAIGGIHLGTQLAEPARETDPEAPFRILVLGDFSGRGAQTQPRPMDWVPRQVDRDNFETVLGRLGVALHLDGLELPIAELDDFGPDRLYERVPAFEELRQLRRRLQQPATFAQAAAEIRSWSKQAVAAPPPANLSGSALLEQMLGGTPAATPRPPVRDPLQELVESLVAPFLLPGTRAEEAALIGVVDEVASARLRALLHHPTFQAVEAAWRGLWLLVRRLETDARLKVFLLDVRPDELAADLASADLSRSQAYRVLVEQPRGTPGGVPWAVLVGNWTFGPADADFAARLAHLAAQAGAPLLAGAQAALAGCHSLTATPHPEEWDQALAGEAAESWQAVRHLPQAAYLGLTLPRFLLRQPYGRQGASTEALAFEEIAVPGRQEDYLWGNGAFAAALLLGQAYERWGWRLRPGGVDQVDGLPTWVENVQGESRLLPCAEVLLSDRAAEALVAHGLLPLQSVQGADAVRLRWFASLAAPTQTLAGRWPG